MNCLNQAISEERIHQVRLLLSLNVDSETRDKKDANRTPLLKASRLQCEESAQKIMRILIKFGVSINAEDDLKRTPLHYACADGKCRVIELLLQEHSIKLNEPDSNGQTPLMLAAIDGHLRAARIISSRLIKFDLDIDVRDNKGYTALLHAVKNQNYGIAYDLIRYANASSTIRDNEEFKNATEWLKKTVEDQQKQSLANQPRKTNVKPLTNDENSDQSGDDDVSEKNLTGRTASAIPLLTISSLPGYDENDNEVTKGEYSLARMVAETSSKAKNLSERDFIHQSRPTSSARSKVSLSSAKNLGIKMMMPTVSEQGPGNSESRTRPSTAADEGSVYSCNVSQGSRLGDDLVSTPGRSLFSSTNENKNTAIEKPAKEKIHSAKKSALSGFKVDLGRINVSPSEFSYAPTHSDNVFSSGEIKDLPERDLSRNNSAAIEMLDRALKNQKKSKVSRTSTSISLSPPQEEKSKGVPLTPSTVPAKTTARTDSAMSRKKSPLSPAKPLPKLIMKRFLSQSTISDDHFENDYLDPNAIEKAKKNIRTLFSLYTDSLLWSPLPSKPESLMVQMVGNESDKLTLASDLATSVSDLASIIEKASVGQSEDGNTRQTDAKPASTKSRLVSATSRVSRKSARVSSSRASSGFR